MSPFRRKRDGEDETPVDSALQGPVDDAAVAAEEPDPAAWALPADAGAVTSDAGTAATASAVADPPQPAWTPPPSPGPDFQPAVEKFNEVSEQRPELLVAGAFAGAFLFARILKRITND